MLFDVTSVFDFCYLLHRRAGQSTAAYTCVLNAECQGCVGALTERAKLLWQTGKREAALNSLHVGLKALAPDSSAHNLAQSLVMPSPHAKTLESRAFDTAFIQQVRSNNSFLDYKILIIKLLFI